jgi:hypothetical protein
MLQSIDPERLSNKKGSTGNICISIERGNRIDFAGGLGVVRDGNGKNQEGGIK